MVDKSFVGATDNKKHSHMDTYEQDRTTQNKANDV